MAITTGDAIYKRGTQIAVGSTGTAGSVLDGAFDTESKVTLSSDAPLADMVLNYRVEVTTGSGAAVHLYRRDINIQSTNSTPVPSLNNKSTYIGSFQIPAAIATATDYRAILVGVPITPDCTFYIENDTGQTLSASWDLYATPVTYGASA